MDYNFRYIEKKWQKYWADNKTFKVENQSDKPKYYVLDMFPYPSGAGLHVGHPLGYIASDIYTRYKRLQGYNVLHPMGFDAFGLPAEQYAIQTGTHPQITTNQNIDRYRAQLNKIGFSYDWDREVQTCDPKYYKWTQWTFIQLFNHWYDIKTDKAQPISILVKHFEEHGSSSIEAICDEHPPFSSEEWKEMSEEKKNHILMNYRLAYLSDAMVNWCQELCTVLANDEVSEGLSIRGGHKIERKLMKQWSLRITAYAERLLNDLEKLDWSESLKDIQRNWIGKSEGATLQFRIEDHKEKIEVFTTRPDTIYGATFMVLAPEHELALEITTPQNRGPVKEYIEKVKMRSERERITEVKKVTGVFTGSFAINPLNQERMKIYISDYVLAGYGTGAIMAVPAHDSRDFLFAKHFLLPIIQVVKRPDEEITNPQDWDDSYDSKEGIMINSGIISGLEVKEAIDRITNYIQKLGVGKRKTNYKLRDAIFSRQRYWGEPFPIYYKNGIPYTLPESELPLMLPVVDKFLPTETGEPPLARAKNWKTKEGYPLETNTMPGFAGSNGYYLRFMDPHNDNEYFSKEANDYWQNVDLYIGGAEHGTGHLIYSRFWNKFLFDLGYACKDEPFAKLINQGMIQGRSSFVYRVNLEKMAEYELWEELKDKKLGVTFLRDYKDGRRRFDFYSEEAKIIIEVKRQQSLEKIADPYEEYTNKKGFKLLLIPVSDFLNKDKVIERIKKTIRGEETSAFVDKEPLGVFPVFVSKNYPGREHFSDAIHVDINLVNNDILDIEAFRKWQPHLANAKFILEDGKYICGWEVEKMSKSKYNVQNPDDLIEKYGADTLRLYEMFLGPIEQSKPWDTNGIEGVFRFIRKLWRLFHDEHNNFRVTDEPPTSEELRVIHGTIKKVKEDIEQFSFNTGVSNFMICVNELHELKCHKRQVLEPLVKIVSPYAPHIAEELWQLLGYNESSANTSFPENKDEYLIQNTFEYPVSFNGKLRFKMIFPTDATISEIEKKILESEHTLKWIEGKKIKKVIVVPQRIINVVVG
ncbi:MAG: class I tRNA ligase family protein [Bacteroidales bacterium]|jgi:leucyl-tRNA synthetase|nr:class I tRNA ligase family protein [Bacteroidales bacterium]